MTRRTAPLPCRSLRPVGDERMLNSRRIGNGERLSNGYLCCPDQIRPVRGLSNARHSCAERVSYGGKSNNARHLRADQIAYGGRWIDVSHICARQVGYGGRSNNESRVCARQVGYGGRLNNGFHCCAEEVCYGHSCADEICNGRNVNNGYIDRLSPGESIMNECADQIGYGGRLRNRFHCLHRAYVFILSLLSVAKGSSSGEQIRHCERVITAFHGSCRVFMFVLSYLLVSTSSCTKTSSLGVNYGMIANNLPPPIEVVSLIRSISVGKSKLYSSDPNVLQAFANTGVSFIIGIGNEDVGSLSDPDKAKEWVKQHIGQFYPETKIIGVTVGNEVFASNDTVLMSQLLPAMQNLQAAIISLGLDGQISISTPHSLAVLQNSFPPSSGSFKSEFVSQFINPHLKFLSETESPFMINAYPFFAYKNNPQEVSLDYVLFEPNPGMTDPGTGLRYYNMFDAQVDAVYVALEALGYGHLKVMVSETGWPSAGDPDEAGATVANAEKYNANLINHLASGRGTPLRPDKHVETYIFALFNENLKPGPTSERNYGLFHPDGTRVYNFPVHASDPSSALYLSTKARHCLELSLLCLSILFYLVLPC